MRNPSSMAAVAPAYSQSRLPPTPPPSPPTTRRRHRKKHHDPFLSPDLTPPNTEHGPQAPGQEPQESRLTRILLTPILFTSFLISLFLVNRNDRARRAAAHPASSSFLRYFAPTGWLNPEPYQEEPYQDPANASWLRRSASNTHVEPHSALNPRQNARRHCSTAAKKMEINHRPRSWHLHRKIPKLVKLEIDDAFEMRKRVIVLMLLAVLVCLVASLLGLRWIVRSLW